MNTQGFFYNASAALLRLALIGVLVAAIWNIYTTLPRDSGANTKNGANAVAETSLQIVLRDPSGELRVPANLPVELYPIDVSAAQNEFFSERRPGKRLDDFLAERMGNRAPVEGRFDEHGEATVMVKPGPWWIHTTVPGQLNIEWRLRVSVSGQKQTVELTQENAYTRTRSF